VTPISRFTGPYAFLSNFYPVKVALDGEIYFSVEHAYQAAKTCDSYSRKVIQETCAPGQAKRLGKHVTLRPDWEAVKLRVMEDLLRQKFPLGSALAEQLLATGDAVLEEGNVWGDRFWGICQGVGQNWLGKLLMQIRADLVAG
jgi:ribA/ribD-fused uncharacterized protein